MTLSYRQAHRAVRAARGNPEGYLCALCGSRRATQWAVSPDADDADLIPGRSGSGSPCLYSERPEDYIPVDPSCHVRMDRERAARRRDTAHLVVSPLHRDRPTTRRSSAKVEPPLAETLF